MPLWHPPPPLATALVTKCNDLRHVILKTEREREREREKEQYIFPTQKTEKIRMVFSMTSLPEKSRLF